MCLRRRASSAPLPMPSPFTRISKYSAIRARGKLMTTQISHFINGQRTAGQSTRTADVMDPNTGQVQAKGADGIGRRRRCRGRRCGRGAEGVGRLESAAPGPGDDAVHRPGQQERRRTGRNALARARQDRRGFEGRHPARHRGHRVRGRHPAPAQGRVHRGRRHRHRRVLPAPAARRRRRHHPVQLPGDDPAVEGRARAGVRQRVHPQAQRA